MCDVIIERVYGKNNNRGSSFHQGPGKSLNLLKKNPGLESPWKLIRSLKVLEFFFQ